MVDDAGHITRLLRDYEAGDRTVLDELLPLVYDELRQIAGSYFANERRNHTLQPTALVHEAYMRLVDQRNVDWQNRAQFYGLAAKMMRRILVNHAAAKRSEKRGGQKDHISIEEVTIAFDDTNFDLLDLNEVLERLSQRDAEKAEIVEMKFFGGMTTEEIADALGRSTATIERGWTFARSWLYKELAEARDA
ncbi:sigma-70 family RNA polymerase sigma factor [Leptolyngbya sp. 7M]|uniref:sigma-70 family RNA polymerase sigma factor n=1 Tax=Leptolyngbya sp. 7M TaxID=2812896 RepID=UPI001B8AC130|nr:sigma-70 family RNA polymerase sigma factor [Leptolyngbya sp. 7M]QYO66102.1 sigma-70 family RNA polymerase sigma factor [Leptolyngbya sp. 7M]